MNGRDNQIEKKTQECSNVSSRRGKQKRRRKVYRKRDSQEMKSEQERKSKQEQRSKSKDKMAAFFGWCTRTEALMQSNKDRKREIQSKGKVIKTERKAM